jgi:hypothetical protein
MAIEFLAFLASQGLSTTECDAFRERLGESLPVELSEVTAAELGGVPLHRRSQPGLFRVGSLIYDGRAYSAFSRDSRFEGITVSPESGPHHRCGYGWTTGPNVWDLSASWPQVKSIVFSTRPGVMPAGPGSTRAAKAGASPMVDGYRTVATWPFLENFVGLMHPISAGDETLIVLFWAPEDQRETTILARIPFRLQFIAVMAQAHSPEVNIHVWGRDPGGPLRQIMFWADDPTGEDPSLSVPRR